MTDETKSLLVITQEAQEISNALLSALGEINEELEQKLEEVKQNLATKTDSYAWLIKSLEADEEKFRDRADMFVRIARGMKAFRERLKENIKQAMQQLKTDEIKGQDIRFKLSPSAPSLVIEEEKLPNDYKIISYSPDKQKIKDSLSQNTPVPGASLVPGTSLRTFAVRRDK